MTATTRLGVLGGTFDPIHFGHLDAAQAARRALALTEVVLIPSRLAPHRPAGARASTYHRFAMVALAALEQDGLVASDLELGAPGPSYTSQTLERLAAQGYTPSQLFFITGADAFAEIATWRDYPAFLQRSQFVVVSRPGCPAGALRQRLPELAPYMREVPQSADPRAPETASLPAIWLIEARTTDVSSTTIRRRLQEGAALDGLTPPSVEAYIRRHRLYGPDARPADHLHEEERS